MAKPEKQRYSGVAVSIDGIQIHRVQTVTVATDIGREQTLEMGNAGVVEWVEATPAVTVTLDTNEVGSTDTLALLTDKMIHYTSGLKPDWGPRNTCTRTRPLKYFIRAASSNARTVTAQDMLSGYCSLLIAQNQDGTSVGRTTWINHAALSGVAFSYDANGNATENYTLIADNKTVFLGNYADVRAYKCVPTQVKRIYSASSISFMNMASSIPIGSTVLAIGFDGYIARFPGSGTVTDGTYNWNCTAYAAGATQVNGVSSATFTAKYYYRSVPISTPFASTVSPSTNRVTILYNPPVNANTWEATQTSVINGTVNPGYELETTAGAWGTVRRGQIKAYLWNTQGPTGKTSADTMGKALRLQNVAIDISLGEEQLFEIGSHGFYGISKNTPIPVTITTGFTDADAQYFAMLSSHSSDITGDLKIEDFNGYNSLKLLIYKEKAQTNLLKTIEITQMAVTGDNFNVSVGGNATHEITFTADNITVTGSKYNVTGGSYGG